MDNPTLHLKPIDELLSQRFFIPSYQRGYRWTERQVTELLNDIWEFQQNCKRPEEFYCLQPIVVKKRESGEWELVDGQQRLTTILLILTYNAAIVEALRKPRLSLRFETRPSSEEFLAKIDFDKEEENIDYFYICRAYTAIKEWSESRSGSHDLNLIQCLTNDEQSGKNVKVIWYELPSTQNPVEAFTRLNVGKIPLTSAELIRALFIRSKNFDDSASDLQQLKIAQEWDSIEKALQSDEIWYFLHTGGDSFSSRIEFIFERLVESAGGVPGNDPYATFHFFHERLEQTSDATREWLLVKQCFMTLEEWFNDRVLYHLIGYLINEGITLQELIDKGRNSTKNDFKRTLKGIIFRHLLKQALPDNREDIALAIKDLLEDLNYEDDRRRILSTLLLFNIATLVLVQKSNLRFPFDLFKKEKWDIEHVHSAKSDRPETVKSCINWLNAFNEHLCGSDEEDVFRQRARTLLEAEEFNDEQFRKFYEDVLSKYQDDGEEHDNSIGNLTLLDSGTNRSYKNSVFPVKRQRILNLERKGMFVPLCTKNVFLKCYSNNIGNMLFWGKEDQNDYRESITETLTSFFASGTGDL